MKPGSIGAINQRIADLEAAGDQLNADGQSELRTLRRQRAERKAVRRTQFERERAPLFADQTPATQADDYVRADVQNAQMWRDLHAKHQAFAIARRQDVAGAVSPEDLAAMDTRWRTFLGPHTPTYEAAFWLERYRDTFHKNPMDLAYRPGEPWPPPDRDRWAHGAAAEVGVE